MNSVVMSALKRVIRITNAKFIFHISCLLMLMATAVVVLKHETSTTYQSHIYQAIDLKFGKSDYVTRFSNPAKFSEDRFSGGIVKYTGRVPSLLFLFLFLYSLTRIQPIPVN